jgi:hypothetical protein
MNVIIQVIETTRHYSFGLTNDGNILAFMWVCMCVHVFMNLCMHPQHYSLF